MESLYQIIIIVLSLNFLGVLYLVYRNVRPNIRYEYFWDGINEKKWIYNKKELNIKAQLYVNNIPVGLPHVICTYKEKELDRERIEWLVKQALPMAKLSFEIVCAYKGNPLPFAKTVVGGLKKKS